MGEMSLEDDHACGHIVVSDICSGAGTDMHPGKIAPIALLCFETSLDLFQDLLFVQLGGAVLGQAGDAGLGGIPVALPIQVEMRGLIRQAA